MKKNDNRDKILSNCHSKTICDHITATSQLVEKATIDIIALLREIEKIVNLLPKNDHSTKLINLIASGYEVCTFEDLASQHLAKVKNMLNNNTLECLSIDNSLLRGPALEGEPTISQDDVDKMLKS